MTYAPMPSLDQLFDLFYVDSTSPTGLRWARNGYRNQQRVGDVAGCLTDDYARVQINGRLWPVHRLIHKMRTGQDRADCVVDHIDRNKVNNHPFNLRWKTPRGNSLNREFNTATGFRGVTFRKDRASRPFQARMSKNGKVKHLGFYDTAQEAHAVYLSHLEELS